MKSLKKHEKITKVAQFFFLTLTWHKKRENSERSWMDSALTV